MDGLAYFGSGVPVTSKHFILHSSCPLYTLQQRTLATRMLLFDFPWQASKAEL